MKKHTIKLGAAERRELEALLRRHETKPREHVRARVLLLSEHGWERDAIVTATGCSTSTVSRVRRQYLEEGLHRAVHERPRPGPMKKLTASQEQQLVALACTDAPRGFARWSLRLLTKEAIARGIVGKMSREPIRLALLQHGIKPWREKNVVHSSSR